MPSPLLPLAQQRSIPPLFEAGVISRPFYCSSSSSMEMYNGSDKLTTDAFMIPATGSSSLLTSTPPLEEIEYMGSEVASEFVEFDQGLYYPAAANYYGYYCTGFESPGEWDDHHWFFGVDGQNLHYSGLQTESLPYVYYMPSYGYAQSPYNPYNPYIPGAVVGLDGPFVGTQQYLTSPTYQQPVSSSAYFPVVVQSGSDVQPVGSADPSLLGAGASVVNKPNTLAINYISPLASGSGAATSQKTASGNLVSEPSQCSANQIQSTVKESEGSLVDVLPIKQPSSREAMALGSISQVTQGRSSSGSTQATERFMYGRDSSLLNPLKVTVPASNDFASFGSHAHGWPPADKFRPRFQYSGVLNNVNGSLDILGEQNRGPRTNKLKGPGASAIAVRAYTTKAGTANAQGNIVIYADQYNRDDFPADYPDAKFFVIKSYSEDDVHKSIKYNVWSSTPNGNKRLDSALEEAQRISLGRSRKCPIFLFFSVNASGQFCGVAEMVGPVDFGKDMDFWQQDKWTGSFPVKWHIVKDVPNNSFRHIILENNENKPVTNSRDTQEVTYLPGMSMLNIFKNSPLRTSILDDLMYYEERQRIMYEEKCRLLGRDCDTSLAFGAVSHSKRTISSEEQLPNSEGKAINGSVEQSLNTNKELNLSDQPLKVDSKQVTVDRYSQIDGKQLDFKADQTVKVGGHHNETLGQSPKADGKSNMRVDQILGDGKQPSVRNNPSLKEDEKQHVHAIKKPCKAGGKQANATINQPPKVDGKQSKGLANEPTKVDEKQTKPTDLTTSLKVGSSEKQITQRLDSTNPLNIRKAASRPNPVEDAHGVSLVTKIGSLSIDSKIGEANCSAPETADGTPADVVTVGSVHIKVKKTGELSSGILTVGSIPIDPKAAKLTNT